MQSLIRAGTGPIGLAIASVALVVAACEFAVRIFLPQWSDPWKLWRVDPVHARGLQRNVRDAVIRAHSGEFAFRFGTNAQGLRMSYDLDEGARRRRAIFVGDSFTFGYGVDQGETFSDRLQSRLRTAGVPLEVINAGFASGFTLDTEYVFTREVGARWQPELVVAGVCLSNDLEDFHETRWRVSQGGIVSISKPRDWIPVWLKRSGLLNLVARGALPRIAAIWTRAGRAAAREPDLSGPCERAPPPSDARLATQVDFPALAGPLSDIATAAPARRVRWILGQWARNARERDYELVLLFVPDAGEVQWPSTPAQLERHAAVRRVFVDAATENGLRIVDPAGEMRRHFCDEDEPLYYSVDGHWNAAGHRLMGDTLARELFAVP